MRVDTIEWSRKGRGVLGAFTKGEGGQAFSPKLHSLLEQAEVPGEDKKYLMTIHRQSCDMSLIEGTKLTQSKTHTSMN